MDTQEQIKKSGRKKVTFNDAVQKIIFDSNINVNTNGVQIKKQSNNIEVGFKKNKVKTGISFDGSNLSFNFSSED